MKAAMLASILANGSFTPEVLTKSLFAWLGIFAVTAVIVIVMLLLGAIKTKGDK